MRLMMNSLVAFFNGVSMKSGLGDRNNVTRFLYCYLMLGVSMKSGLGDRNNQWIGDSTPSVSGPSQ